MTAAHGSGLSDRWFTPPRVIDMVRAFIGEIDLDPCSEEQANQIVRATRYYTAEDDGLNLTNAWYGRVFVNPPGGTARLTQKFWERLASEYDAGNVQAAAFLSFSLDTLQTCQSRSDGGISWFPTFIFDKRFTYYQPSELGPVESKAAMRPSCLTVLPQRGSDIASVARLLKRYTEQRIGGVWVMNVP